MRPFTDLDASRCQEATALVESIKAKLAAGAEFRVAAAGEIYATVRDDLKKWNARTFVSIGRLESLRRTDKAMKGKKK